MNVLITGGSGFLGFHLTKALLEKDLSGRIVILSRNEHKQQEMKRAINDKRVKFMLGDVRNMNDVLSACSYCDVIVHAAAVKRIDAAEENPIYATEVNIRGTENVMMAANQNMIQKVIYISTDKASRPHTTYGATKYCAEQIVRKTQYNVFAPSVIRYGNVLDSTGSVLKIWEKQYKYNKTISVRDKEMTRFFWHVSEAVEVVLNEIGNEKPDDLIIPEMKALNIYDMAKYIYPDAEIKITGITHNEKIHEELYPGYSSDKFVVAPKDHVGINKWLKENR